MSDPRETVEFLSASPYRLRILEYLHANPGPPSDITAALELSRRGVQRNLAALADRGWIVKTDGSYRLTTVGICTTRQYTEFLDVLATLETCEPLFTCLPDGDHAPNPSWLTDAEVVIADSSHPLAPVKYHSHVIRTCSTGLLRSIVPTLRRFRTIIHGGVLDRGIETELVLPRAVATLAGAEHPAEFEAARCLDTLDLRVDNGMVGLELTLTDQGAIVGAYDNQGRLRACVHGTNPALRDWAERLYERYRAGSCPITPEAMSPANQTP